MKTLISNTLLHDITSQVEGTVESLDIENEHYCNILHVYFHITLYVESCTRVNTLHFGVITPLQRFSISTIVYLITI